MSTDYRSIGREHIHQIQNACQRWRVSNREVDQEALSILRHVVVNHAPSITSRDEGRCEKQRGTIRLKRPSHAYGDRPTLTVSSIVPTIISALMAAVNVPVSSTKTVKYQTAGSA